MDGHLGILHCFQWDTHPNGLEGISAEETGLKTLFLHSDMQYHSSEGLHPFGALF